MQIVVGYEVVAAKCDATLANINRSRTLSKLRTFDKGSANTSWLVSNDCIAREL
jgi:hypothetical protein